MIQLERVVKRYGAITAVDRATLQIDDGEAVVIRGPSGCGKTTLLRLISGLDAPDEGCIRFDARPAEAVPLASRRIGFVFQRPTLWPHMSVARNVLFGVRGVSRRDTHQLLDHLLDAAGLTGYGGRFPGQLSGGEARRVAVLRALAPRPRYLLLDEPLVNLEPELRRRMLDLILEWRQALVYVTHEAGEAERVGGRVLEMDHGQLA